MTFDFTQKLDLGKMLDIKRQLQHFVAKAHIDNRQVDEHAEIKIDIQALFRARGVLRKIRAVGANPKISIVFGKIR